MSNSSALSFDAVILAGGEGRRMGGIDKAELVFQGKRLLDRVAVALADADRLIAVGPSRTACRALVWTREHPVGGGPAAAVAAALGLVGAPLTMVAAVDLPLLDRDLIADLVQAATGDRAAVAVDRDGTLQPLLACYPTAALKDSLLDRDPAGMSMMELLGELDHAAVDDKGRSRDCDTALDLDDMRIGVNGRWR